MLSVLKAASFQVPKRLPQFQASPCTTLKQQQNIIYCGCARGGLEARDYSPSGQSCASCTEHPGTMVGTQKAYVAKVCKNCFPKRPCQVSPPASLTTGTPMSCHVSRDCHMRMRTQADFDTLEAYRFTPELVGAFVESRVSTTNSTLSLNLIIRTQISLGGQPRGQPTGACSKDAKRLRGRCQRL